MNKKRSQQEFACLEGGHGFIGPVMKYMMKWMVGGLFAAAIVEASVDGQRHAGQGLRDDVDTGVGDGQATGPIGVDMTDKAAALAEELGQVRIGRFDGFGARLSRPSRRLRRFMNYPPSSVAERVLHTYGTASAGIFERASTVVPS